MDLILIVLAGYLMGSVPFALVVGKLFYKTDIRNHGSGNLGGGNTGRVLGAKAGVAVMTLDLLKVTAVVLLARLTVGTELAAALGALSAAAGHCWPVFAKFRGGKAVATLYGFLFGLWVCLGHSPLFFFLPLAVFLLTLKLTRVIALASIVSSLAAAVYGLVTLGPGPAAAALVIFSVVILVRHRSNLARVKEGRENKISWM